MAGNWMFEMSSAGMLDVRPENVRSARTLSSFAQREPDKAASALAQRRTFFIQPPQSNPSHAPPLASAQAVAMAEPRKGSKLGVPG